MHRLIFYPLGNADSCLIDVNDGDRLLLFDYAATRSNDDSDLRVDLPAKLREELSAAGKDAFDAVAFTHADNDHIQGFSDFFFLEHAKKYQDDDRIKINDLWVPAAVILEEGLNKEDAILRAEARYRLKQGLRIRVFSKPDKLKYWLEAQGLSLSEREHLITGAGNLIPEYAKEITGVEFFVHAPVSAQIDGTEINRNNASLVVQATFQYQDRITRLILGADLTQEPWADVVRVTKYYENDDRLLWDVFKVSHHCSYLVLNKDEKGTDKTEPVGELQWLFEQGQEGAVLVSSSKPIPSNDDDPQPPHRQAANYYKEVASTIKGEFKVTMEHPKPSNPAPLVITIDQFGATAQKVASAAGASSRRAPRVGVI